jgi:hypothetical protein
VYLEDLQDFPCIEWKLTFIFMFLWTLLSVEFIYIRRVILNSLFIPVSQSQNFFIGVSFHFLNNTGLQTNPRYQYTVLDLIWTPLCSVALLDLLIFLVWFSETNFLSILSYCVVFFTLLQL